jgi:S-DNA-T family DNA segregation ATPase FtsK/SpoIIIE
MSSGHREERYDALLPERVEARLLGLSARSAGGLMLAATGFLWLSLLTWSVNDPSLTHPTGAGTGNAGGPVGAILSDITLQMLGFGAVVCLFAPMMWAIELLRNESVDNFRSKAMFYPLSILLLAGAISTLPVLPGWPLHHAMGGMLGDLVAGLTRSTIGTFFGSDLGTLAAGLGLFAAGFAAAAHSIGSNAKESVTAAWLHVSSSRDRASWHDSMRSDANGAASRPADARTPFNEPSLMPMPPQAEPMEEADQDFDDADQRPQNAVRGLWRRLSDGFPASSGRDAAGPRPSPSMMPFDPSPAQPTGPQVDVGEPGLAERFASHFDDLRRILPGSREAEFEDADEEGSEELSSRSIARRFAPLSRIHADRAEPVLPDRAPVAPAAPSRGPRANRKVAGPAPAHPPLALLNRAPAGSAAPALTQAVARATGQQLMDVLADYGVKGEMRDIKPGPVVTLYEFEPVRGTKSARVIAVADDVARSMSVTSVRAAVVPGRNAIGFELPNAKREAVLLREMLESDSFRNSKAILPLALGKSIGGEPVVADLARMPHLLVAGTTGSGKSVGVNAMILSLLYKHSPDVCRFIMIDPKMLELSVYNGIPHLLTPVVTDPHKAVAALGWAVTEMEERYKRMAALSVRNIEAFNQRVKVAAERGEALARTVQTGFDRTTGEPRFETQVIDAKPMPYIVVVVDEFADLMIVAGKEIEQAVQRLAQMARAAGIHLIMATQRPSVDIITGTIKANFPTRISFKVTSKIDSRTILNEQGAEQLLGQGDMLFSTGAGSVTRVHGPFVSDEEVEAVSAHLRSHGEPDYVEGVTDLADDGVISGAPASGRGGGDDLYEQARDIVLRERKVSTSYIQRRLSIGYNRAADIIERMEREGLISPASSTGKREILKPAA